MMVLACGLYQNVNALMVKAHILMGLIVGIHKLYILINYIQILSRMKTANFLGIILFSISFALNIVFLKLFESGEM